MANRTPRSTTIDPDIDESPRPSKSAFKREAQSLQDLGELLIELPQNELDALALPDNLHDAVMLARRITAHGGLSRQKQYIGKLMRKVDAEPIRLAIEARQARDRASIRQFQQIERWRNRLVDEAGATLDEFLQQFPESDAKAVTRLVAQAKHEREQERPPKAARELFALVQQIVRGEAS